MSVPIWFKRTAGIACTLCVAWFAALPAAGLAAGPEPAPDAELENTQPADTAQFETTARRYWKIVQTRPRRGAAFDLWYRHYLDAGKLDELAKTVDEQAQAKPGDLPAQLLLGLVCERRGEDEKALAAFSSASQLAPQDYYPLLLKGTLLARLVRLDDAATALEQAIALDPPRSELLEMYKQLGRLQLKRNRPAAALKSWEQLVEKFPNYRIVLQELAELLTQEGQYDEAIRRWEQVAALSQDDLFRQSQARIELAQLMALKGDRKQALEQFDRALEQANPESWVATDVQRRIEDLFLKNNNPAGWLAWCEQRAIRRPDDLRAQLLLGRAYAQSGRRREPEALAVYRKAVRLAPSRREVREALIAELVRQKKLGDAVAECEQLAEKFPTDVDALRKLGDLHLQAARPDGRREAELRALDVWKRIAAIRPQDASLAVQVAEICRRAAQVPGLHSSSTGGKTDLEPGEAEAKQKDSPNAASMNGDSPLRKGAEEYYREAIRRAPGASQYHEYLGEYLHALGRRREALEAWSRIVAPPGNTAENWRRLAELESANGYLDEALATGASAIKLQPDDFKLRDFQLALLVKKKDFDGALGQLAHLERLAAAPLEEDMLIRRRVEIVVAAARLDPEIAALQKNLAQAPGRVRDHIVLALLLSERLRPKEAAQTLAAALMHAPNDLRLLARHAEILELAGDWSAALAQYRRLASLDSRNRAVRYEKIARLELQLKEFDAAKQTADQLVQLAPSNLEGYRLQAEVAFRMGRASEGLSVLRRAVHVAPRDIEMRTELAQALALHQQPYEALEHYWQCFELAESLPQKVALAVAMTDLSPRAGGPDAFLQKLRQLRQRQGESKTLTLCLVAALRRLDNADVANRELTTLLKEHSDDLDVLVELAEVAASKKDWSAATALQQQIVTQSRDPVHLEKLAQYLLEESKDVEAVKVFQRLYDETGSLAALIATVDRNLHEEHRQAALWLIEWGLERSPKNWELLFRAGYVNLTAERWEKARQAFEALADLPDEAVVAKPALGAPAPPAESVVSPATNTGTAGQPGITNLGATAGLALPAMPVELREFSEYRARYARFLPRDRTSAIVPAQMPFQAGQLPVRRPVIRPQQHLTFPRELRSAKADCEIALFVIARNQGSEADWLAVRRQAAKNAPLRLRSVLLALHSVGTLDAHPDLLTDYEQRLPHDPLPHLALIDAALNSESWRANSAAIQAVSAAQQQARLTAAERSFAWLAEHRPDLKKALTIWYGTQLRSAGDTRRLAQWVRSEVQAARTAGDLECILEFAVRAGDSDSSRSFLERAGELARDSSCAFTSQQLQTMLMRLLTLQSFAGFHNDECEALLTVFDRYLRAEPAQHSSLSPRQNSAQPGSPALQARSTGILFKPLAGRNVSPALGAAAKVFGELEQQAQLIRAGERQVLERQIAMQSLATHAAQTARNALNAALSESGGEKIKDSRSLQDRVWFLDELKAYAAFQSLHVGKIREHNVLTAFPFPNSCLDAERLFLLHFLYWRFRTADEEAWRVDWLARWLGESDVANDSAWRARQCAQCCVLWWSGKQAETIAALRGLCGRVPQDAELRLMLAHALFLAGEISQTLEALPTGALPPPQAQLRDDLQTVVGELAKHIRRRRRLTGHVAFVRSVAFCADGATLVSGSSDGTIKLWEVGMGLVKATLDNRKERVTSVAFAPDGETLASASDDQVIYQARLWDAATGQLNGRLSGHPQVIRAVQFSPDGKLLATASDDQTIKLSDVATGTMKWKLSGHTGAVSAIAFAPDGKTLASAGTDKTVRIWNVATGELSSTLPPGAEPFLTVAYAPDGRTIAAAGEDGVILLYDAASGRPRAKLKGHAGAIKSLAYSPDGRLLASASRDGTVKLWDPVSGELRITLEGHRDIVSCVAFSPDGKTLASCSFDLTIRLWELAK